MQRVLSDAKNPSSGHVNGFKVVWIGTVTVPALVVDSVPNVNIKINNMVQSAS